MPDQGIDGSGGHVVKACLYLPQDLQQGARPRRVVGQDVADAVLTDGVVSWRVHRLHSIERM